MKIIQNQSHLKKENIFLMPGNWENAINRPTALGNLKKMAEYGSLITRDYAGCGVISIDGKKIQVAHFPQHPIPKQYLPDEKHLYKYHEGQAHTLLTMKAGKGIPPDVDLNVYGHTHIRSSFYDQKTGQLTINTGPLTRDRNDSGAISYAIYDTEKQQVEFYDAAKSPPALLQTVSTLKKDSDESFNLSSLKVCNLTPNLLAEFESKLKNVYVFDEQKVPEDGSPLFESWMEKNSHAFLTHGIWNDNVDAVLKDGFLKPAELLVREKGVVSYEKGKQYGDRAKESINRSEIEAFAKNHPLPSVCDGIAFLRIKHEEREGTHFYQIQIRRNKADPWKTLRQYKDSIAPGMGVESGLSLA